MPTRLLTINIRKYLSKQPRRKRPARISRWIRFRIAQSTNIKADNIKIKQSLNELITKKYLFSMTPLKLSIDIDKDKGIATVSHFEKVAPKPTADAKGAQAKADSKKPVEKVVKPAATAKPAPAKAEVPKPVEKPQPKASVQTPQKKADATDATA